MRNMFSIDFLRNQICQIPNTSFESSLIFFAALSEVLGPSLALANTCLQALENGTL